MTKYTAEDFARADFARHEDGRIAARMDPVGTDAWCAQLGNAWAWYTDANMAADPGWSIVRDDESLTAREHLDATWEKAHVVDVIPAGAPFISRFANGSFYVHSEGRMHDLPAKGINFENRLLDPPPVPARPEGADGIEAWLDGMPESIRLDDEHQLLFANHLAHMGFRAPVTLAEASHTEKEETR